MPQSTANLKALGLNYSPNQLSTPDGSLIQADNIVIRRDNVVESRRGLRRYSEPFGGSIDRAKQLIEYKERILVHYGTHIAFDTGVLDADTRAIFQNFDGMYTETDTGLRIKSIEANKNLYFTSSDGIKKISATSAIDFTTTSGFIQNAGAVKALDIEAQLLVQQGQLSGFLPADSTVAYRGVWGYKDANKNLLLGTPSNRYPVYNYLSNILAMDLNALTDILDKLNTAGSMIRDGNFASNYYSLLGTAAFTLQSNIIALAKQIDKNILYASSAGGTPLAISTIGLQGNIVTITFSSGNPTQYFQINDQIDIENLNYSGSTLSDIKGNYKLDQAITSTTISFTLTHTDITPVSPLTVNLYSYNYRYITGTGSDNQSIPLATLVISTPPTNGQDVVIQDALFRISNRLKIELPGVINTTLLNEYVLPYSQTNSANVKVLVTIPKDITSLYFLQLYRTRIFQATSVQTLGSTGGNPVEADDEMRLVYEAFPTSAELAAGQLIFIDQTPNSLVQNNTNLYTNPETGEGILAANEPPPFAKDINTFRNVTFYANTRTKHNIPIFQLLGLSNIHSGDKITITNSITSDTYTFVTGVNQVVDILFTVGSTVTSGMYYEMHSAMDSKHYVFWQRVDGVGSAPVIADSKAIYVMVDILSTDTIAQVAYKNKSAINIEIYDFSSVITTPGTVRITNSQEGKTTVTSSGTTPFTATTITQGNGEDASAKQVLLSSLVSAAQAIAQTAQSLVRVINKQNDTAVAAYYTSGDTTPPGQITLQAKNLNDDPFYILGSTSGVGISFNPDVSPIHNTISSISASNPSIVTFSSPHGLNNGDKIIISGSNSVPNIDGLHTVTAIDPTHLSIPVLVTTSGTSAVWSKPTDTTVSTNEVKPNRIYYSKTNQPESVPLLNFFDISAQDKSILRIKPLRDSLFVFKQDGTYRISGQVAPFVTNLLDSSCILSAPDSIGISNNIIYAWTTKGITPINESGASSQVSRPIDTQILNLSSPSYPNFSKLTWGIGYDSDYSYTVYTNSDPFDTVATIGFRYCTLTNTWTNITRAQTCGAIIPTLDQLYLGSGISNIIDRERKQLQRFDYADDDFQINLQNSALLAPQVLQFINASLIERGDVVTQVQSLSIDQFNTLLDQLDFDPSLQKNYAITLQAIPGDNMRSKIVALAAKLDADPGTFNKDYSARIAASTFTTSGNSIGSSTTISTVSPNNLILGRIVTITGTDNSIPTIVGTYPVSNTGIFGSSTIFNIPVNVLTAGTASLTVTTATNVNTYADVIACFNDIINHLNSDIKVTFKTYQIISITTLFEAVVTAVDYVKNRVTVNLPLQWVTGSMTVYKAINCEWTYTPCVMGDPLSTKQMFDASFMFRDRAITGFVASFSSDLFPEFFPVPFVGHGNGIFGHYSNPGMGYSYFGGQSHSAPFRTYIPMTAQRCRYINLKLNHKTAREEVVLYGITLTGKTGVSFRGYR